MSAHFAKKGGDMKKTAPDYEVGDTVKHIKFGTGVVQANQGWRQRLRSHS